jgi:hypothetical protein
MRYQAYAFMETNPPNQTNQPTIPPTHQNQTGHTKPHHTKPAHPPQHTPPSNPPIQPATTNQATNQATNPPTNLTTQPNHTNPYRPANQETHSADTLAWPNLDRSRESRPPLHVLRYLEADTRASYLFLFWVYSCWSALRSLRWRPDAWAAHVPAPRGGGARAAATLMPSSPWARRGPRRPSSPSWPSSPSSPWPLRCE